MTYKNQSIVPGYASRNTILLHHSINKKQHNRRICMINIGIGIQVNRAIILLIIKNRYHWPENESDGSFQDFNGIETIFIFK